MPPGMNWLRLQLWTPFLIAALLTAPAVTQACVCKGMTWVRHGHTVEVDRVGTDSITNAYNGDTACSASLPILCLKKEGLPAPSYITPDFYNGWTGGHIQLTSPRLGTELTSRAAADALCANAFGAGWAMAEFHDGHGGWNWYAYGSIAATSRFWVAINDQSANPWNCPAPPPVLGRIEGRVVQSPRPFSGPPLADVWVDAGNGLTARTDASGRFVLNNLPLGTYTLRASKPGWTFGSPAYQSQNSTVVLTSAQPVQTVQDIIGWDAEPVVFVHGWNSGPGEFSAIPSQLSSRGIYVKTEWLETGILWTPPLGVNARRVKAWIDEARHVTGRDKAVLYGSSMGGLVARAYVEGGDYEGDVSQLFTYGSPHLGTPALLSAPCYILPRPDAICQMTKPGMALFNLTHFKRQGVDYHLVAGDAPMLRWFKVCFRLFGRKRCIISIPYPDLRYRNFGGWVMGLLIPGNDDAFIQTCSASGMLGSNIDRYLTNEVHTNLLGQRSYFNWDGGLSEEGYNQCSKRILVDRNATTCGNRSWGPPLSCLGLGLASTERAQPLAEVASESTVTLGQLSRIEQGPLAPGERKVRTLVVEGGTTAFSASWEAGTARFTLIDPTGKVIDPAYAASIEGDPNDPENLDVEAADPDAVVYSGDTVSAAYYFPAARPGTWQLVLEGGSDIPATGTAATTGASFDSPLSAGFSSDRLSYDPGSTALLRVSFSEPVQSADVQVAVRRTGRAAETVRLTRVSAQEYTARYEIPAQPGYAALDWSITGQREDGKAFERGGREFIQIHSPTLLLASGHTDRAVPRADVPSLNSALAVTLSVQSSYDSGELGAFAELAAADGTIVARAVRSVPARRGQNNVELRFRAEDLYRSKRDGPYTVQNVRLLDERDTPLLSQEAPRVHTTQAYSYRSFAPRLGVPAVFLDGPFQVTAGESITLTAEATDPEGDALTYAWDLDSDGDFEVSGQSVPFTTSMQEAPGLRTVRVSVTDSAGNSAIEETRVEVRAPAVNHPPVARCRDVMVPADETCGASSSVNDFSYDPDAGDSFRCVQTPSGPYSTGAHRVTLTCTDATGLSSSCEATVTLKEWSPLTLSLQGEAQMTLECGVDTWSDPGAKAWDTCGPLTVQRYNSGHDPYGPGPDTRAEGTYSVQYLAMNAAGQSVSGIRTVHVDDRTAPVLRLLGPQQMTHPCGSGWTDPGVEALDACYGNLSATVRRSGYVNGWAAGSYTVRYEVTDSGGNSAPPVTRTVEVAGCPW